MNDEMEGRLWVRHGGDFVRFVSDAIAAVMVGFERLVAIEFDAPWRRSANTHRC